MSRLLLLLWGWRDEQVHLRPGFSLLRDPEDHVERVAECDGGEPGEEARVHGLVPVRGELVGCADEDRRAVERECLSRLEPRLERLLGQLLTGAIEQPAPSFVGSQRHVVAWKTEAGERS